MEAVDIAAVETASGSRIVPILSLPQAIGVLLNFPPNLGWIFRGEVNSSWVPVPRAGRPPFFKSSGPVNKNKPLSKKNPPRDLGRFGHWRDLAAGYARDLPQNDFECLAYAQHYGMPTRLQDWTENPLVALYFATEELFDIDGAIYAFFPWDYVDQELANLYHFPKVACLKVKPFDRRLLAQHAAFVYFPDPSVPLKPEPIPEALPIHRMPNAVDQNLIKIRIPADSKLILHRQLRDIGMTRRALFPDLEGLSDSFVAEDVYDAAFQKAYAAREAAQESSGG
jgi:hypothetical protein